MPRWVTTMRANQRKNKMMKCGMASNHFTSHSQRDRFWIRVSTEPRRYTSPPARGGLPQRRSARRGAAGAAPRIRLGRAAAWGSRRHAGARPGSLAGPAAPTGRRAAPEPRSTGHDQGTPTATAAAPDEQSTKMGQRRSQRTPAWRSTVTGVPAYRHS